MGGYVGLGGRSRGRGRGRGIVMAMVMVMLRVMVMVRVVHTCTNSMLVSRLSDTSSRCRQGSSRTPLT